MGVAAAAPGHSRTTSGPEQNGDESVEALSAIAQRLSDVAVEAAELDERAAAVVTRERELEALAASLAEVHARQLAQAAELDERERAIGQRLADLTEQGSLVASHESTVVELQLELGKWSRALEERAERFHWRWFLRAWAWRPRVGGADARVCELFLVPTPRGYKLLEQTGVAVTPRARISGLIEERTTYVVTKLAQLPFDGRWCAYLEIDEFRGGDGDD